MERRNFAVGTEALEKEGITTRPTFSLSTRYEQRVESGYDEVPVTRHRRLQVELTHDDEARAVRERVRVISMPAEERLVPRGPMIPIAAVDQGVEP